jgi:type I restriction enzyme S subunit
MKSQIVNINNVAAIKGGKRLPKGHELITIPTKHPYIRARDIGNGKIEAQEPVYITDSTFQKIRQYTVKNNDIVITIVGVNIGDVGIVTEILDGANLTENAAKISTNINVCNPYFLLCQLATPRNKFKFQQIAAGAAQGKLGLFKIKDFKILLPPINTQKSIAYIYFTYTNLINTNRRRIQLLEEAARLLFREWFVYFRFPGHEKVKIVDSVPKGWKKGNIKDISNVKSGYAFNSKDWLDEGNPVIKIRNIIGDGSVNLDDCSFINQDVAAKVKDFSLKKGDLLIAMTGATIGKVGLLSENSKTVYLNQRVGKFIPKFKGAELILYCFFMSNTAQNHITNYAGGAAQLNISASQIESIKIIVATRNFYNQFVDLVGPMFEEILNLRSQNQKLTQARDLLLPRLMSGEIEV